jgi:hypothetical protein
MARIPTLKTKITVRDPRTDDMAYVSDDDTVLYSGLLMCSKHRETDWCQHIQIAVLDGDDAEIIWDPADDVGLPDFIMVPVVPSRKQWARVDFGDGLHESEAVKCYLRPETVEIDVQPEELDFLGFLNRGEGRGVLRQMIIDNLQLLVAQKKPICNSTRHGYKAELLWGEDMKRTWTEVEKIAQYWSVINTQQCLTCSTSHASSWDDLIPDASTKPRFGR